MPNPLQAPFPAPGTPADSRLRPSGRSLQQRVEDAIAVVTSLREEAARGASPLQPGEAEEHLVTALRELHALRHKVSRG